MRCVRRPTRPARRPVRKATILLALALWLGWSLYATSAEQPRTAPLIARHNQTAADQLLDVDLDIDAFK